jgi:Tfp pilus assembly protein PilX
MKNSRAFRAPRRQRGVVIFLALIMLVLMTLGGLSLFSSVDTGIGVSGNIASQRSATRSGDFCAEQAITWLAANSGATLYTNSGTNGYIAAGLQFPNAGQTWEQYWTAVGGTVTPITIATDAAGNSASCIIERQCNLTGSPYSSGPPPVECVAPPTTSNTGSSMGVGFVQLNRPSAVYYRITTRIEGPRHSLSFIQTMYTM